MPASCSVQRLSKSISRRCLEPILKWNWHLGHTNKLASRSLRNVMVRQLSHLVHKPSVRTRRSSGGVASAIAFFSLLNHAISRCFLSAAIARTKPWTEILETDTRPNSARSKALQPASGAFLRPTRSIVYTTLGENAFGVGMFHFL